MASRSAARCVVVHRACGLTGDTCLTIRVLADRLGLAPSEANLARAVERRLEHERFIVEPSSDALAALAAVRARGDRVGILSDCSSEIPELWPTLPYAPHVDAAVFSYDLGVRKPDERMYTAIALALGVERADCVYVGDGSSNELSGARAAGMTAVMLDGCIDVSLQYDREHEWHGPRIATLREVAAALDGKALGPVREP